MGGGIRTLGHRNHNPALYQAELRPPQTVRIPQTEERPHSPAYPNAGQVSGRAKPCYLQTESMEPDVRAAIVYIAARMILDREAKIVYDVFKGKRYYFTGQVSADRVHIWDYDERCFLSGELRNGQFAVWHHRNRQFVDLRVGGRALSGLRSRRQPPLSRTGGGQRDPALRLRGEFAFPVFAALTTAWV